MFDRKAHWQKIYRDKSPLEVSWFQQEPTLSLALIHAAGIDRNAAIIDVGGGASVLVDHLLDEGHAGLAVLDISGNALDSARKRLGDRAATVEWFEQDITRFEAPHPFALWHDRAVFHFLTDADDRRRYVKSLRHALLPGGHVIIAAFAIGGPEKCSGLEIVQYDADRLCRELGPDFELMEQRDEVHVTPAGRDQQFSYFRFRRRA